MESVERSLSRIREILGDQYLPLKVQRFEYTEDLGSAKATVRAELQHKSPEDTLTIVGSGVGLLDALFDGVRERLAKTYPSLDKVHVAAFSVEARLETKLSSSGLDAVARARLIVLNSEQQSLIFEAENRSVAAASVQAALKACEFFVNSERAFKKVYALLEDARTRQRSDLQDTYVAHLAELVKNTSYSAVIDEFKKKHERGA